MELWPAIDLRGGKCVRLTQGDYARETVFGDDPVDVARRFVDAGATRLHIVDLDGAKAGGPIQASIVRAIVAATGVPCQVGGGIRSLETAAMYHDAGLARIVVGSVAVEKPELLQTLAESLPGTIVLGLDARDGRVATRGWLETSELAAVDVAKRHERLPLAAIVYTDIARDGMLSGPNLEGLSAMVRATGLPVVASGGVAVADDIARIRESGAAGCIVGRAFYEGTVTLAAALAAASHTDHPHTARS